MVMKTTLNLDESLMRRAKKLAAERGVTLTATIELALRELLNEGTQRKDFHLEWATVKGDRAPDFDVANRDALYDRMDGRIWSQ